MTEAKARLGELIHEATEEDVVVLRQGHPAAVLVGAERYDALFEEQDDLKGRLSVCESAQSEAGLRVAGSKRWRRSSGCGNDRPVGSVNIGPLDAKVPRCARVSRGQASRAGAI